jgi:hypothetical protein
VRGRQRGSGTVSGTLPHPGTTPASAGTTIRENTRLICEVWDHSHTSPHPRYANDEGGRGLFFISQLFDNWSTRYTSEGKIIWADHSIPA